MNNTPHTFNPLKEIEKAAMFWYGSLDIDYCCLAENRLMRGEKPKYKDNK